MGRHPTVGELTGEYAGGVKLTKAEMKPVEARLERSATVPKYDRRVNLHPPNAFRFRCVTEPVTERESNRHETPRNPKETLCHSGLAACRGIASINYWV